MAPGRVVVVVPIRDEEETLVACLDAVHLSVSALRAGGGAGAEAEVEVIAVLDRCTDGSADIARASGARTLTTRAGSAGAARAAGCAVALGRMAPAERAAAWLVTTDADSVVPVSWLGDHLAAAGSGAVLAVGTVEPRRDELDAVAFDRWSAEHDLAGEHEHVFGANLGVRADVYIVAGGFAAVPVGEDRALVESVQALGHRPRMLHGAPVLTSARRVGRARGGFASRMAELSAPPRAAR